MNLVIVFLVIVVILSLALFSKLKKKGKLVDHKVELSETSEDEVPFEDFNDKFFRIAKGRPSSQLVKVYETFDKDQIRAMLDSSGIITYVEFENINSLMPGFGINGYSEVYINVLDDDFLEANELVKEYIEDRRLQIQQDLATPKNPGTTIVRTFLTLDGFRGNLPELINAK